MIRSNKVGRVRTCELRPKALSPAEQWMTGQRAMWEACADCMSAFAERLHLEEQYRDKPEPQRRR